MKKFLLFSISLVFVLFVFGQKLPFQGKLIETGVPVNGTRTIVVALPDLSWSETHTAVTVTDGLYFIVLGSTNPLPANMFVGVDERQLTLSVDGTALSPVTLYKPLTGQPDGLDLKGPGNGTLKGGFGTGSVVNENLPTLKLNGNLTNAFDRISANVSSNGDNTTEYGNVSVSSTDGYNSHFSPGYLGLNYNNDTKVQLFSQNWSGKGQTGYMILRGPSSINFEIGSKFWENSDLPWMNMQGTSNASLVQLSGEKYQDAGVDKEKGQILINSTDGNKAAIIPTQFALHNSAWGFYGRLFTENNAGKLELRGPNSTNFHLGIFDDPDHGFLQMNGKTNEQRALMFVKTDGDQQEKGTIELHGQDGNKVGIIPTQIALHKPDWSFYGRLYAENNAGKLELNGNNSSVSIKNANGQQGARLESSDPTGTSGFSGRLILSGPNNDNIFMGTKHWETSGLPIIQLKGSQSADQVIISVNAKDPDQEWSSERGFVEIHNSNGNFMQYQDNGVWSPNGPFNMLTGASVYGNLNVNGNITYTGTSTQSSDQRLKKDIQPLEDNILQKVKSLKGVSYFWRKDEFPQKNFSDDQQIGLIAQQLEAQFPALVKTGTDGFKSVNYNGFTAVLLQAVKELNLKVESLEAENKKLQDGLSASANDRSELDQLKSQMDMLTKLVQEKSFNSTSVAESTSSTSLK